jgi:CTP:molybdopterin cytidylyltransferase MocA
MINDRVTAMVLCLGAATRMRPLSLSRPKALLPFCGRPLLAYTLEELGRRGVTEVALRRWRPGVPIAVCAYGWWAAVWSTGRRA